MATKAGYLDALIDGSAASSAPTGRKGGGIETVEIAAHGDVHNDDPGPPHGDGHINTGPDPHDDGHIDKPA